MYLCFIPFAIESYANARLNPGELRAKQRDLRFRTAAYFHPPKELVLPLVVTFTKFGTRLMDDDNLSFAFKRARDVVSEKLGINDGDNRVYFIYKQENSRKKGFTIAVESLTITRINQLVAEYKGRLLIKLI